MFSCFFSYPPLAELLAGGKGRRKDNPEAGRVPLPALEPRSGRAGQAETCGGGLGWGERGWVRFRACLKAGPEGCPASLRTAHGLPGTTPAMGFGCWLG